MVDDSLTNFIKAVNDVVSDIDNKKYDSKIPDVDNPELNEIIRSLNSLLDKLKKTITDANDIKSRFEALYDSTPDMHRSVNKDNIIIACNKAYADFLGYTKKEAIGMSTFDHLDKQSHEDFKNLAKDFGKTGKTDNYYLWFKRKDGSVFPAVLSSSALRDDNGNIIGSSAVIKDVSDVYAAQRKIEEDEELIKKQDKQLREATQVRNKSELKYRNIYDNAIDLYRVTNANNIIIDCNKSYAQNLGYTKEEIIGHHTTFEHTAPESIPTLKQFIEDWKKTNRVFNREIWLKRKDGTTFPCLISSTALYDEDGNMIGSNTIIKDITEIYVARKRIEELEKQLGQQGQLKAQ